MSYVGSYIWSLRQVVGSRLLLVPGAQVLVLDPKGRGLFQRRRENDVWEIPAGSCEPGQDFRSAAVAELREETGLHVEPADLVAFASLSDPGVHLLRYPNGDHVHAFALCFSVRLRSDVAATETDEAVEHRFLPLDAPPEPLHPPTRVVIGLFADFQRTGQFQAR